MARFIVLSPVKHDHKRYEAGATILLKEDQAAPLLALGVIKLDDGKARAGSNQASADTAPLPGT